MNLPTAVATKHLFILGNNFHTILRLYNARKKLWQLANATIYSWFQSMLMKMFPQYIRHNMIVGKRSNLTSLEIRLHVAVTLLLLSL
jgi:hypothetical protein